MQIIQYPHPALIKPAKAITTITPKIKQLATDMLSTLVPNPNNPIGVGLSANQVNQLHRLFIVKMPNEKYEICLNPQILKTSSKMLSQLPEKNQFLEGCLSFPRFYGFVDRPVKIKVSYQTLSGLTKTIRLAAPYSIYFQHENDHLNGVLFIDYLKKSAGQLYFGSGRDQLKPIKNPF
ncbi:MAG: peptide deformylase [Patescibacteria group bacterium]|nr:peptide deformylase [Patescibacteria group bacterium]